MPELTKQYIAKAPFIRRGRIRFGGENKAAFPQIVK